MFYAQKIKYISHAFTTLVSCKARAFLPMMTVWSDLPKYSSLLMLKASHKADS